MKKKPSTKIKDIHEHLSHCDVDSCKIDKDGQLVYYSGAYLWKDGTYHTEMEHHIEQRPCCECGSDYLYDFDDDNDDAVWCPECRIIERNK